MPTYRFAKKSDLPALLAYLAKDNRVLVPVEKPAVKQSIVFEEWQEGKAFKVLSGIGCSPEGKA